MVLGVSSTCITLTFTGVEHVAVPITTGVGAGLCIFSKIVGENLKRKEQHNIRKQVLVVETFYNFCKLHSKCLEDI